MSKPVIICVDDEKIVLDSLRDQIRAKFGSDLDVEIAESAEEAKEVIQELLQDGIDVPLVISDQIMPGMKGDEFLVELHKMKPQTIKVLLTGQADIEAVGNAVNNAGLYRYISKPWDVTDLVLTIKEATNKFFQDKSLQEKNKELEAINKLLDQKVKERTEEVRRQSDKLEKQHKDITSSINYAKRIQQGIIPEHSLIKYEIPESFIFFKPRDIVSGDFYWHARVLDKFVIAAVDCTGHGVPGAFMSVIGLTLFKEAVEKKGISSPERILEEVHIGVKNLLGSGIGEINDGMDAAVIAIDFGEKTVEFAGAKLPIVYIEGEGANQEPKQIKGDREPVGGHQREKHRTFTRHTIKITQPTSLYIFTDGFQDQFGGLNNTKYKSKNFRKFLSEIHDLSATEQRQRISAEFDRWINPSSEKSYSQIDDVLVIGLKLD